jgi:Calcineurin-like phosphoesterase
LKIALTSVGRHFIQTRRAVLFPLFLIITLSSATVADIVSSTSPNATAASTQQSEAVYSEPTTFVQITDAHLFDEGKKRDSKADYLRDQQDNRRALRWAIEQINQLISHGRRIDFVVFTGDFGLELVDWASPCNLSDKDKQDFDRYRRQGWPRFVPMRDAANEVANEFSRIHVSTIYLLPGNNDLVGELPCDQKRYSDFVQQVVAAMPRSRAQVVDLVNPASAKVDWNGLRVFGLNSATFKLGKDDKKIDKNDAGFQIGELEKRITGSPPGLLYLIFTHIPDLEDPYTHQPSWHPDIDRKAWVNIATKPEVAAIFAAHFHSVDRLLYGAPGQSVISPSDKDVANKTWVAPPLAIKAQDDKPETARGFLLVRVQKTTAGSTSTVNISATPFWYEGQHPTVCWCYFLPVLAVMGALAIVLWGIYLYAVARNRYPVQVQTSYPTLLTLVGLAGIAVAIRLTMRFMIEDLSLPAMYWAAPIFGAIGGIFGGLGEGNSFSLTRYDGAMKIRAGILGDVVSGIGGAIAIVFVSERALGLKSDNFESLLWLASVSFIAGVAGRKLVQMALQRFLQQQKELSAIREELQKTSAKASDAKRAAEEALAKTNQGQ